MNLAQQIWRRREELKPLFSVYDPFLIGQALAEYFDAVASRSLCAEIAAVVSALTDFEHLYDYLDFYASLREDGREELKQVISKIEQIFEG